MKQTRKEHSPGFKAKVALAAQSGIAGGNVPVIIDMPVDEVDSEQGAQPGDQNRHLRDSFEPLIM